MIAGTDCGFGTFAGIGKIDPDVVVKKLGALAAGAELASPSTGAALMTEIEELLIERACERLIIDSATHNDQRDWPALAALYAEDGVVVRPNGQRLEGRAAIEAAYAAGPAERVTRHVCANLRVARRWSGVGACHDGGRDHFGNSVRRSRRDVRDRPQRSSPGR